MPGSFVRELKRRNVFRVAAIYIIVSWVLMQVGDVMFPALRLPDWTTTMLVAFLLLGFPIALVLSWAYEATPEGIKRTSDVAPAESITDLTGRKINYVIIATLVVAVVFLAAKIWITDDTVSPAVLAAQDKSIAVLPFANISVAEENAEFFAAGVHDELLTLLSNLGDLKVISRTSVENIEDGLGIPEIGTLLGVATVLEGQVQRAGNSLRINVQLIRTTNEDHLWATTYDRELTAGNVFEVQSNIARAIADSLHAELSADDEVLLNNVPTENTEALRLYMLGRQSVGRSTFESMRRALRYFEQATTLDPQYAEAWTAIASIHGSMLLTGMIGVNEYVAAAKSAVARALQLNDRLAEAHAQQATLHWREGDLAAAEVSFKRALQLNPDDSESLRAYGTYLRTTNRPQLAIPVLEHALDADPLSIMILFNLGKAEMYIGHPERTLQYAQRILEIDPASGYGYTGYVQAYSWMGQQDLVWPWIVKLMAADPEDFETVAHFGLLAEGLGASAWADRYMDRAFALGPNEPVVLKCYVQILTLRGQYDKAFMVARQALDAGLDDRWSSNQVFLRAVRNEALKTGDYANALAWYRNLHPELFGGAPFIDVDNINTAADLALLLQRAGEAESAGTIIEAGLAWYRRTQVAGVHGNLVNIVDVELLAMRPDKTAAMETLRVAIDSGWEPGWNGQLDNENLATLRDEPGFQAMLTELEAGMARQLKAIRALPDMGEFDFRNVDND
jgi:TolB-like protein/Tfp pilus assembly protein PilF